MDTRLCLACHIEQPLDNFNKTKSRPVSKRKMRCKTCEGSNVPRKAILVPTGITQFCITCQKQKDQCNFLYLKSKGLFEKFCKDCKREGKNASNTLIRGSEKRCTTCLVYKDFSYFGKVTRGTLGLAPSCKDCTRILAKINYEKRKTKPGHDERKQREKEYYERNKKRVSERNKIKRKNGDFKNVVFSKKRRDRFNEKMKTDPIFKLTANVKALIRQTFKNALGGMVSKGKRSLDILGCSGQTFLKHLESQFLPWMSWSNHGNCLSLEYNCTWQLDHVIPISLAKDSETVYLLNHWSNFQPLCSRLNQWEKRNNVYPCSNIILMITVDADGNIEKVNINK